MATQIDLPTSDQNDPALRVADALALEISALHALQADGDYSAAVLGATRLLSDHPSNRDLLLIEAHSLRMMKQTDAALAALERFEAHHPHFSQMYLERGLCHVAKRDAAAAIQCLRTAVSLNPDLVMAWHMLDGLYRMTGDSRNADLAARHSASLSSLPQPIVHAKVLHGDGESVPAGTPAPIVKRISEALSKALATPEVRAKLEAQGGAVAPSSPEEYRDALFAEIGLTEKMMKSAKLEAQ